jgi:hypothetical protein
MPDPILHVVVCKSELEALVQCEVLKDTCDIVSGPERYSEAYWVNRLENPPEACDALEGAGKQVWVVFGKDL